MTFLIGNLVHVGITSNGAITLTTLKVCHGLPYLSLVICHVIAHCEGSKKGQQLSDKVHLHDSNQQENDEQI